MIYRMNNGVVSETGQASEADVDKGPLGQRISGAAKSVERFIATKPEVCLGLALGIGMVTGWIIKRHK